MSNTDQDLVDMVSPVPEDVVGNRVGADKVATQRNYRSVMRLSQKEKELAETVEEPIDGSKLIPNPKHRSGSRPTSAKKRLEPTNIEVPNTLQIFTDLAHERQRLLKEGRYQEAITLTVDTPLPTGRTSSRPNSAVRPTSASTVRGSSAAAPRAPSTSRPTSATSARAVVASRPVSARVMSARGSNNSAVTSAAPPLSSRLPLSSRSHRSDGGNKGTATTSSTTFLRESAASAVRDEGEGAEDDNDEAQHQDLAEQSATARSSTFPPKHPELSLTERIACLYSPCAVVRTKKRDDQMDPITFRKCYRLSKSEDVHAAPRRTEHTGVFGADSALSHFLDANDFDDDSNDLPVATVLAPLYEGGEVLAYSKYYTKGRTTTDGEYSWAACRVLDYHAAEGTYQIRWLSSQNTKWVRRLNIIFSFEDIEKHEERIVKANRRRDAVERTLRKELYIQGMPEDVIGPMQEVSLDRILHMVAVSFPKNHLGVIESSLKEVRELWVQAMKKSIFDYTMMDPREQERVVDLCLPEFPPFPIGSGSVSADDLHGTIDANSVDFEVNRRRVQENLFVAHTELYHTIYEVVNKWHVFEDKLLVDPIMNGIHLPCELRDFEGHQSRHVLKVAMALKEEWTHNITSVVQSNLTHIFNFYEDNVDRYLRSRVYRFFRMLNLILAYQLQDLVNRSVVQYATMFRQYAVPNDMIDVLGGANDNPTAEFFEYVGGTADCLASTEPPSIRAAIALEKENERILAQGGALPSKPDEAELSSTIDKTLETSTSVPAQGTRARDRRRSTVNDASLFDTGDKKAAGGFSAKAVSGRTSLFVIRLSASNGVIEYEPKLDDVAETIRGLLTNFINATDDLVGLGEQLFRLLTLPPVQLTENARMNRATNFDLIDSQKSIQNVIERNLRGPIQLESMYSKFQYMLSINVPKFVEEFATVEPPPKLEDYDHICDRITQHMDEIQSCSLNEVSFPLVKVECYEVKQCLISKGKEIVKAIMDHLIVATDAAIIHVDAAFREIYEKIQKDPETPEELNQLREFIEKVPTAVTDLNTEFDDITLCVQLLGKYGSMPSEQVFQSYWGAYSWPRKIQVVLDDSGQRLQGYRQQFTMKLRENNEQLASDIVDLQKDVGLLSYEDDESQDDRMVARVEKLEQTIRNLKEQGELYNGHETIFSMPLTKWTAIREIEKSFAAYNALWKIVKESKQIDLWQGSPFTNLDAEQTSMLHQNWSREISKLQRALATEPPIRVVNAIKEKLDNFKPYLPLIAALRKPGLRARHWHKIGELIGKERFELKSESLSELVKMKLSDHVSSLQEISEIADNEYKLDVELSRMKQEWAKVQFTLQVFKETRLLKDTEDVAALLDDHISKTQTMLSSAYVTNILHEVKPWEQKLLKVQSILEEWLKCQGVWHYLEPIFNGGDIVKSMPDEAKLFEQVNAVWLQIMESTSKSTNVMSRCGEDRLLPQFQEANQKLDKILRELHKFLETKRVAFPRFFFLSNEDLLEILSETKQPRLVQKHLKKCFEGIHRLTFSETNDITEMISEEGEVVKLTSSINPSDHDNMVEIWLYKVEQVMCDTIRDHINRAIQDYLENPRDKWLLRWPGQVVICGSQFHWTRQVEEAINGGTLTEYETLSNKQLEQLVMLVRGDLDPVQMLTLQALVVIEVHARDIVTELKEEHVRSTDAFAWRAQLRYYYESYQMDKYRTSMDTFVRQTIATLQYGNEYLGNQGRLVITPLTDRCYRTLTSALELNYGGAPEGPAGTGKTETTKDLAKAIAKQCVVFNCSDQIKAVEMEKLLRGLASSGAWACFDEFNRIEIQVLSVIAQQVLTIQLAVADNRLEFDFEGKMCSLKKGCSVFITMNPGYAGRSDLPDNLKNLFRPVAMMVPDYALIGEISLYSCGFIKGRDLARKIVSVYKLCSEQLSSQNHYDYGMRAVKAVLTAAARLKRENPDQDEGELILRAIQDVNLAKFLAQDATLFKGIISDLFPEVTLPDPDYDLIQQGMEHACAELNLQKTNFFTIKTLQLYEMVCVRHGVMVVGYSISGKSSSLKMLSKALTWTCNNHKFEYKTNLHILNPKSVTMDQLYGYNDASGTDWHDGILSNIFRTCASDEAPIRQWLILDGPVDAIWIENMNTVLDDNKKLCLTSGAIIRMTNYMTMLFEVQDLAVASPATVSRCGMIYMEPNELGWHPLVESWKATLPKFAQLDVVTRTMDAMFNIFFDAALEFMRKKMKRMIELSEQTMAMSFLKLMSTFLDEYYNDKSAADTRSDRDNQAHIESLFIFCLVWTVGAIATAPGRKMFNTMLRELCDGADYKFFASLPERSLYEYLYVIPPPNTEPGEGRWATWLETIEEFKIPEGALYHDIMVPTSDTARYKFFVKRFIDTNHPILLVGDTGTGKTVMVKNVMMQLSANDLPAFLQFSAQTSANQTQFIIENRMEKRGGRNFGPPVGKRCIFLVDDMSMPDPEKYGAQPPIELLRQFMDYGGWYEHKKSDVGFKRILSTMFLGCMQVGRSPVTLRFLRHFNTVCITTFDDESMTKIFSTLLDWIVTGVRMPASIRSMGLSVVAATIELYNTVMEKLLPTPEKSHYSFNLRDVWKVFQGMSLAHGPSVKEDTDFLLLWVHENLRVFQDRLINNTDRDWFRSVVNTVMGKHLKKTYDGVVSVEPVMFDDFANEERNYQLIADVPVGMCALEKFTAKYHEEARAGKSGGGQLIIFNYVMQHVARIGRIIKLPYGHALLIGVGGSGRSSATRLAAYIGEFQVRSCTPSRKYTRDSWRDDLAMTLRYAGEKNISTIFLLNDGQIKEESFLEDISSLLNTGEIPNLFLPDVYDQITDAVKNAAKDSGHDYSKDGCWAFFIKRCRMNLHVVMCMSPVGTALRGRLRRFPSLVNCTTIDWFSEWPVEGLKSVAMAALSDSDLTDSERERVVDTFVDMHTSVEHTAERYLAQQRQHTYVTPTSYLELIGTFKQMLVDKLTVTANIRQKYEAGLQQLFRTEEQIAEMQRVLEASQPKIEEARKKTQELIVIIDKESEEAAKEHAIVAVDEEKANQEAQAAQEVKDDCEANLAVAMPTLKAATDAVSSIDKKQLVELRSMQRVSDKILRVLKAVCVTFGDVKPIVKTNPATGKKEEDWWSVIKTKVMADVEEFRGRLINYPKDNMSEDIFEVKLKPYINDKSFKPDAVKDVSIALVGVCEWVIAMEKYYQVAKIVKPKQEKLKIAQDQLQLAMNDLNEKKARLKAVDDRLAALRAQLNENVEKKKALEDEHTLTELKLKRALELQVLLKDEKVRYTQESAAGAEKLTCVMGDVLLTSGLVSYIGPYTNEYRKQLFERWREEIKSRSIKMSPTYSLDTFLGDPVTIQKWTLAGLPADDFSVDGAIIMHSARRYPLLIDPQGQANAWIKQYAKHTETNLVTVRPTESTMHSAVATAIQSGSSVLLENCSEDLDPFLEPILLKNYYSYGGKLNIILGEQNVTWNPNFRLYMTTKMPRPHYKPETSTKVSLIAFFITPQGLQDQMLQKVVQFEDKDQDERKNRYIEKGARNKAQLREIEDGILSMLASDIDLLESEDAIERLRSSKTLSAQLDQEQAEVESFNRTFERTRNRFVKVASRGSILFFLVAELCNIDPMYQYSLQWYLELFHRSLEQSLALQQDNTDKEERVRNINEHFLYSLYCNICRSLFSKDTLVFAFTVAAKLANANPAELRWILTGGADTPFTMEHPERPENVQEIPWKLVCRATEQLPETFSTLSMDVAQNVNHTILTIMNDETPHTCPLPENLEKVVTPMQRLIIIRCLRPDRLIRGVTKFVIDHLDDRFVSPPLLNVADVYKEIKDPTTPLIFIISPGSDPMTIVRGLAEEEHKLDSLESLSLGQGMDERAKALIERGKSRGSWVMLQNCHLYKDWMPSLERIVEDYTLQKKTVHEDYRLWLTSMPSTDFPVAVLMNGIKMIVEPPKGLKSNLLKSYTNHPISDVNMFERSKRPHVWKKLCYGLCFFHALIQERRTFGPLGWNIPYEFNDTDLRISVKELYMFIDQYDEVPLEALTYLVGQCNYGGRVTDDHDRRLLLALLRDYFNVEILSEGYYFGSNTTYYAPEDGEHPTYVDHIKTKIPDVTPPSVYGLHANADITKDEREMNLFLNTVLLTQPRDTSGGGDGAGGNPKQVVLEMAESMLKGIRAPYDVEDVQKRRPISYHDSMNTVLLQELHRFNRLISTVRSTLNSLIRAINGEIVLTSALEGMLQEMYDQKLPSLWSASSYPSLKPVGSYYTNLIERLQFFDTWIEVGPPAVFWLSGFYFTQSFLTGVLQNYARSKQLPIDTLSWQFTVMREPEAALKTAPATGCYVRGLFLEGAAWDGTHGVMSESLPKRLYFDFPVMWLQPVLTKELNKGHTYDCPLYRTADRRGVLMTTGHSTNFVMIIRLPISENVQSKHWVKRGVAMLCALSY